MNSKEALKEALTALQTISALCIASEFDPASRLCRILLVAEKTLWKLREAGGEGNGSDRRSSAG